MNIFLYIVIFTMGTLFGSFYSLAVYRIPRNIDIIKTNSFCPNCNHKLGFFELIPVWSYIILGGKCKKCKQKIRPRYIILEILSGLVFILIAYSLKINIYNLNLEVIMKSFFMVLYLVAIFIIAGIDNERKTVQKGVLYYGIIVSCAYIVYLCIMAKTSIYRYVMYLIILTILLVIDTFIQQKKARDSYFIETIIVLLIMCINTGFIVTLFTCIAVSILIILNYLLILLKNKINKSKKINVNILKNIKYVYLLCFTNTIINILYLIIYR